MHQIYLRFIKNSHLSEILNHLTIYLFRIVLRSLLYAFGRYYTNLALPAIYLPDMTWCGHNNFLKN